MSKRIIYVGLGSLGCKIVADLLRRGRHELCAAVDPSPDLAGKSLSELIPGAPDITIVPTLADVDDLNTLDCAIVTTLSTVEGCMPTFRTLLEAGVSVVSTCEELTYPWLHQPELAAEIEDLAVTTGARILGTGVNPGFLMDVFPAFASSVCRTVSQIRVERFQDATTRRKPFQAKIGAAMTREDFEEKVNAGDLGHVGLGESLHLLANHLGLPLDNWNESIEPVIATEELECALGTIPVGGVTGIRQIARGLDGDQLQVELVFQAAIGQTDPHDTVQIKGDPSVELTWRGGIHGDTATSAMALNVIRPLMESRPGLHTMATIPVAGCSLRDHAERQLAVWHQNDQEN